MKTVKVYFAEKNIFLDPKHKSNWSDDIFWRWRRVKQHFLFKSCVFWNSQKTKHGFVSKIISKWLRRVVRKLVLIVITRYIAICHPDYFGKFCLTQINSEIMKFPEITKFISSCWLNISFSIQVFKSTVPISIVFYNLWKKLLDSTKGIFFYFFGRSLKK